MIIGPRIGLINNEQLFESTYPIPTKTGFGFTSDLLDIAAAGRAGFAHPALSPAAVERRPLFRNITQMVKSSQPAPADRPRRTRVAARARKEEWCYERRVADKRQKF